jgi:hypothetical protein
VVDDYTKLIFTKNLFDPELAKTVDDHSACSVLAETKIDIRYDDIARFGSSPGMF